MWHKLTDNRYIICISLGIFFVASFCWKMGWLQKIPCLTANALNIFQGSHSNTDTINKPIVTPVTNEIPNSKIIEHTRLLFCQKQKLPLVVLLLK